MRLAPPSPFQKAGDFASPQKLGPTVDFDDVFEGVADFAVAHQFDQLHLEHHPHFIELASNDIWIRVLVDDVLNHPHNIVHNAGGQPFAAGFFIRFEGGLFTAQVKVSVLDFHIHSELRIVVSDARFYRRPWHQLASSHIHSRVGRQPGASVNGGAGRSAGDSACNCRPQPRRPPPPLLDLVEATARVLDSGAIAEWGADPPLASGSEEP